MNAPWVHFVLGQFIFNSLDQMWQKQLLFLILTVKEASSPFTFEGQFAPMDAHT